MVVQEVGNTEQFERLKEALEVKTDRQLAKEMGISHQAVYQARKRGKIPNTWIKKIKAKGLSPSYIFHGKIENRKRFSINAEAELLLNFLNQDSERDIPDTHIEKLNAPESLKVLAKIIVYLASRVCNYTPNAYHSQLLELFVMKDIMYEGFEKLMDYIRELKKLEQKENGGEE